MKMKEVRDNVEIPPGGHVAPSGGLLLHNQISSA